MKMTRLITLLAFSASLAGCVNLQFDALEYDRFITVKELADSGIGACGTEKAPAFIAEIKTIIDHSANYTASRALREQVAISTVALKQTVDTFADRYKDGAVPSTPFCVEKFTIIKSDASRIVSTLGRL